MTTHSPSAYDLVPDVSHHSVRDHDDFDIHLARAGAGTPVVLLHGWPGFWFDWRRVIGPLSEHADVIAVDMRGFGDSSKPRVDPVEFYGADAQADSVASVLTALGIEDAIICGHDVGSRVAMTFAMRHPERARGLALGNPPYGGLIPHLFTPEAAPEFWYLHFHRLPWVQDLIARDETSVRTYLTHFYEHWAARREMMDPDCFDALVAAYSKPGAFEASIAWYRSEIGGEVSDPQGEGPATTEQFFEQPTELLWGELDPLFPHAWADDLDSYFGNYNSTVLAGTGHFTPWEEPPAWVAAVQRLLSRNPQRERPSRAPDSANCP